MRILFERDDADNNLIRQHDKIGMHSDGWQTC
jgi:hypothetical protein